MKILVLVKQVPGSTQVEVDPVTGVLKRDGVAAKLNPYDLFAVEAALKLREREGGTVCALTMGPKQAEKAILETVAMGADEGALLSDRAFAGSDVLATSYALSQAVRALGGFDLILCGKQTTDGDTAQVGSEVAELLNLPHAGNVTHIELDGEGRAVCTCSLDKRVTALRMALPCLVCMDADVNTPRLPSYRRMKATKPDAVRLLTLADLPDTDGARYGLNGSPTKVERIFPPEKNADKELVEGSPDALADRLCALFAERKFI